MSWKRSLIITFAFSLTVFGEARVVTQEPPDEQLLRQVSEAQNIPLNSLQIRDRVTVHYFLTGVRLEVAKVLDTTTGQAYLAAVDDRGDPADVRSVRAAEENAEAARYGKVDPRLHEKLADMERLGGRDTIPVSIWLNVPAPPLSRQAAPATTAEAAGAALAGHLALVRQHMAPKRQGVVDTIARMGVQAHVPQYAPAVFADLTPGQIRRIARHRDVRTIYGPEEYTLFADDSSTTQRAYRVWAAGNLGAGTSSRPVVHEPDGVADFNPLLNNAKHPVILWCADPSFGCPSGKNILAITRAKSPV